MRICVAKCNEVNTTSSKCYLFNSTNLPHRCVVVFPWFLSSTDGFNVISSFFSSHPTSHTKREERLNSGSRGGSFVGAINRRRHSQAVAKTRRTLSYKVALSLERHFEAIPPFQNAHGYIFHRKAHPFKFPNRRGEFFEVTRSSEYELSSPAVEQKANGQPTMLRNTFRPPVLILP